MCSVAAQYNGLDEFITHELSLQNSVRNSVTCLLQISTPICCVVVRQSCTDVPHLWLLINQLGYSWLLKLPVDGCEIVERCAVLVTHVFFITYFVLDWVNGHIMELLRIYYQTKSKSKIKFLFFSYKQTPSKLPYQITKNKINFLNIFISFDLIFLLLLFFEKITKRLEG